MFRGLKRKISHFYRLHILKDKFTVEMARWFKDMGDKTLRLNYPTLNKDSIVFDLGGYFGDYAYEINKKYGCKVYLFEPHPKFYDKCVKRFSENKKITSFNFGISDNDGTFNLSDSFDGSSFLNPTHKLKHEVKCEVKEFFSVLSNLNIKNIDLIKINIEGGEYPLLKHIADKNKLEIIDEYQIQFHNFVEGAESKRNILIDELSKTHKRTWCYKFIWENWKRT